jgi:uncharacterized membrane protein
LRLFISMKLERRTKRWALAALAAAGFADAFYMLAYHGGLLRSLWCPFFGRGCEKVGRSAHAVHLGVPNAAVGAVGYAAMAALALWAGDRTPEQRPRQALALGALSASAGAVSAFLTWEQPNRVGAWCFWCLSSAAINATIGGLAAGDAVRGARELGARHRRRRFLLV